MKYKARTCFTSVWWAKAGRIFRFCGWQHGSALVGTGNRGHGRNFAKIRLDETSYPSGCLGDVSIVGRDGDSLVGRAQQGRARRMNWFKKLKDELNKSTKKVSESLASLPSLSSLIGKSKLDAASLEEVEDALIAADLGPPHRSVLLPPKTHKFTGPVDTESIALALAEVGGDSGTGS